MSKVISIPTELSDYLESLLDRINRLSSIVAFTLSADNLSNSDRSSRLSEFHRLLLKYNDLYDYTIHIISNTLEKAYGEKLEFLLNFTNNSIILKGVE